MRSGIWTLVPLRLFFWGADGPNYARDIHFLPNAKKITIKYFGINVSFPMVLISTRRSNFWVHPVYAHICKNVQIKIDS